MRPIRVSERSAARSLKVKYLPFDARLIIVI